MTSIRKSTDVVEELLREMAQMVTHYHPTVKRTSTTVEGLIQGTAVFPGGSGLWRGRRNGGPLPEFFPDASVMFVGHNFGNERGYEVALARDGEVDGDFWKRLLRMLEPAEVRPEACFFTNALMGIKPGTAEGQMPSAQGYREDCFRFLKRKVEIVQPRGIVALGSDATRYVSRLNTKYVPLKHPGNWEFRTHATRDFLLCVEGMKLREFLEEVDRDRTEEEQRRVNGAQLPKGTESR